MRAYERIRNYDNLIQVNQKRKILSRIIVKLFKVTPEGALTPFTICDAYCYFVGQTY